MIDFKVYQASGYLKKLVTDAADVRKEYEEISGSLVQFDTPISAPLASLIVDINPVQSGSGDPSPTNVRPITGWTGCEVWVKDEYDTSLPATLSVTFPDTVGTVYGGTLDVVSGLLKSKMASVDLGTLYWTYMQSAGVFRYTHIRVNNNNLICSQYKTIKPYIDWENIPDYSIQGGSDIIVRDSRYTDATTFKSAMSGVQLVYELAEPIEIQLTPQEINTLIGVNNIWADTGDVSVKYRTH